jgi:hypothetical protein
LEDKRDGKLLKGLTAKPKDLKYRSMSYHKADCPYNKEQKVVYSSKSKKYKLKLNSKRERSFSLPTAQKRKLDYTRYTKPKPKKLNFRKYALKKIK